MSKQVKSAHITPADGNVFIDLGFDHGVAVALHAESQKIVRERLATELKLERVARSDGMLRIGS